VVNLANFRAHVKEHSPAFVPLFVDQSRYQVAWGGAGSGKSHIVARKILYRLLKEDQCKHNFLIIRKVDRTIKRSVFALMKNIISKWGLLPDFDINLTDKTMIYRPTGAQIMFSGLDDVEKLKSIEGVTSIWAEEATELTQEDFEQLDLRLRGNTGALKHTNA
jgi:phage terminase large subunit